MIDRIIENTISNILIFTNPNLEHDRTVGKIEPIFRKYCFLHNKRISKI